MNIIDEIREKQKDLILMVNSTFDELVQKVSNLKQTQIQNYSSFESIYPLTNTSGFKGKKVIAVIINDKRQTVTTWKILVSKVFEYVLSNDTYKVRMYELSDKILGRKRVQLSSNNLNMKSALKLADNLYLETHYDTETLMNLLLKLLSDISFDYSNIKVAIKN